MSRYTRSVPRPEEELVELLWQDGNVVMHKQTKHRSTPASGEPERYRPPRCERTTLGKPNDPITATADVTASWLQHHLDDILETDLCTEFLYGVPTVDRIDAAGGGGSAAAEEASAFDCLLAEESIFPRRNAGVLASSNCPTSCPVQIDARSRNDASNRKDAGQPRNDASNRKDAGQSSSTMTKISSRCGSNHVAVQAQEAVIPREAADRTTSTRTRRHATATTTITSSSGGSGSTLGRGIHQKRKRMETEDTEFQSEDGEDYSMEPKRSAASTRRTRSAEVHNLSERKRRDRINEKLKALQDLIPHCTKTDKASVLDEAIEYLKSLQLQLQIMWMGSGMAQMMLPNLQHYFSGLSMGMAHGPVAPMPGPISMPRVPMFNPQVPPIDAASHAFPMMPPVGNVPPMMTSVGSADVYSSYLGLHTQPTPKLNLSANDGAL